MISEAMAFILSAGIGLSTAVYETVENCKIIDGVPYYITFEDDFDGTKLDSTKWVHSPEWKRQDLNNYWKDEMAYLDGEGHFVIEMEYDKYTDRYNSGAVETNGKFEQAYGYYEIKCTLNNVPGYWTAFWLFDDAVNSEENGGRDGTEIDIYESPYFNEKQIQHTLNWDGYGKAHKSERKIVDVNVYDGVFHTFGLLWTKDEYVYYIDGKETWRTKAEKAEGTCEVPLYLIISAETGSWADKPVKSDFPDSIYVDYVRVYSAS